MLISNPVQDLDPNDISLKSNEKLLSGHQTLMTEHQGSLRKVYKIWEKYKYYNFAIPGTYIMCHHKVSINLKFEGSSWKIDFRKYLMRYDAHLQSHPRSWPKWYIYPKNWNPMKTIQVIIQTPTADGRTNRLTDGRTDGGTNRVNPVYPPQLLCRGYNNNNLMVTEHLSFCHFVIQDKVSFICFYSIFVTKTHQDVRQ